MPGPPPYAAANRRSTQPRVWTARDGATAERPCPAWSTEIRQSSLSLGREVSSPVAGQGGGNQQVVKPVVVVAMLVEPLRRAAPAVGPLGLRSPGGEVVQQRPGPDV